MLEPLSAGQQGEQVADTSHDAASGVSGRPAPYAELSRLVTAAGLLEPRPGFYLTTIVRNLALLALGILLLAVFDRLWLRLLDAAFLAVVFAQIAFVGHDIGHGQVARSGWWREVIRLLHGNLLLGVSAGWWVDKHDRHHAKPNQDGLDPDIVFPMFAFTDEQFRRLHGAGRIVARYQAFVMFPLLLLESLSLHLGSLGFVLRDAGGQRGRELFLLAAHFACYGILVFALLGIWQAVVFIVVHQALFGLLMGSVFAPNHKGMPVLAKRAELDFISRQVLTARNVRGHPLTDWWYGGLNYQIEHHLFPRMPRRNLSRAQPIVRAFCARHGIPYHETGVWQSYREILQSLHRISRQARVVEVPASSPAALWET